MITSIDATYAAQEPKEEPASSGLNEEQLAALSRLVQQRDKMDPERRAMIESVAQQNKIPLPPASGFTDQGNPTKEGMSALGEAAKVSALPMAGQLIGGTLGAPLGPAGIIAGQSIGGVAGLAGNKLLGISNPDSLDAAVTGAVPALGKAATVAARRGLPGAAAAEQQIGAELMRDSFAPQPALKQATEAAYQRLDVIGRPDMPAPNFQATIGKLFDTENVAKKYGGSSPIIRRAVKEAGETMQNQSGNIPFRDVEVM
jgi:hypothetical protein